MVLDIAAILIAMSSILMLYGVSSSIKRSFESFSERQRIDLTLTDEDMSYINKQYGLSNKFILYGENVTRESSVTRKSSVKAPLLHA